MKPLNDVDDNDDELTVVDGDVGLNGQVVVRFTNMTDWHTENFDYRSSSMEFISREFN